MGGRELELSELAVIRPLRTTANGGDDGATPNKLTGSKDGEEDAAETGCVTPTAAAAAASLSPRRPGIVDAVDVDIGCVVVAPTTAVTSSMLPLQVQGDDLDDSSTGCVTPTTATSPPTTPRRSVVALVVDADSASAACYVTPTSAASVLRPATECPPAPRKPARSPAVAAAAAAKRKRCPQRCFFPVPRDLTKVFVARGPVDGGGSPTQGVKKIRVNPVV